MVLPAGPIMGKAFWPLAALGGLYAAIICLLAIPAVQIQAIYMHKLQLTWFHDLTRPEHFGFAKNQVTPFYIDTEDGEKIFAWHVLPLGLYARHRDELVEEPTGVVKEFVDSKALQLIRNDPEARLVIHYHGNAGTVGAAWRPIYLRTLSGANPEKMHVLTIDYRGFGYSSGAPSEEGLIKDGLAAVRWAMEVAQVPPERIALVGQSLGTAVTIAVAEKLATSEPKVELGAIVTVAAFSNMKSLVKSYHVGGFLPVLSPLGPYPKLQNFLTGFVTQTWETDKRIARLVKASSKLKLYLIHAISDNEIPSKHTDILFFTAANATLPEEEGANMHVAGKKVNELKVKRDFGFEGYSNLWPSEVSNGNLIEHWEVKWGEHNRIMASAPVALLVTKSLGL